MTTTTQNTLALIRSPETTVETVAETLGCTIDFAAGLIDAVEGERFFADGCIDWCEADESIKAEYRAGFCTGETLVEEEATAEVWQEAYTLAAVEAANFAACLPVAAA